MAHAILGHKIVGHNNKGISNNLIFSFEKLEMYIPEHVDPPFRFMLTHLLAGNNCKN